MSESVKKMKRVPYVPGKRWVEKPPFIIDAVRKHQLTLKRLLKKGKEK